MSRRPEPDVERLIHVIELSQIWNCPPSVVLREDSFYVIGGLMVLEAFEKKRQRDMPRQ